MDQNEAINSINSDLIRGHIDTIILKALQAGDRYGYDIIKEIEHKSDGQYVINADECISCGACAGGCPVDAIAEE